jgi:hypothetical protein
VAGLLCGGHIAVLVGLVGIKGTYAGALAREEKVDIYKRIGLGLGHTALHLARR